MKKTGCLENKAWKLIHNVRKKKLFLLNTASNVDYRWNEYLKDKTIYVIEKNRDLRAEKEFLKTPKSCTIRKNKSIWLQRM